MRCSGNCVNHTRVGNAPESKVPSGQKGTTLKKNVLRASLDRAAASASTPGLVVGDLNMKPEHVSEVITEHAGDAHNIRYTAMARRTAGLLQRVDKALVRGNVARASRHVLRA